MVGNVVQQNMIYSLLISLVVVFVVVVVVVVVAVIVVAVAAFTITAVVVLFFALCMLYPWLFAFIIYIRLFSFIEAHTESILYQ